MYNNYREVQFENGRNILDVSVLASCQISCQMHFNVSTQWMLFISFVEKERCENRYQTKVMILDTKYFKPFTWWTITQLFLFVKVHCNLQYDHAQKITKNQRENGINGNFTHKRIISQLYIKIPINIIYLNIYIFILSFCIDPTSNNYAHDVFKKGYLVAIFVTTCF